METLRVIHVFKMWRVYEDRGYGNHIVAFPFQVHFTGNLNLKTPLQLLYVGASQKPTTAINVTFGVYARNVTHINAEQRRTRLQRMCQVGNSFIYILEM